MNHRVDNFDTRRKAVDQHATSLVLKHRAQAAGGLWLLEIPFAPRGSVEMVPWMP